MPVLSLVIMITSVVSSSTLSSYAKSLIQVTIGGIWLLTGILNQMKEREGCYIETLQSHKRFSVICFSFDRKFVCGVYLKILFGSTQKRYQADNLCVKRGFRLHKDSTITLESKQLYGQIKYKVSKLSLICYT